MHRRTQMGKKLDHLVNNMRELVCSRPPGSRFFTIRELMHRYQVSQLLIYKAIGQLKVDGLLQPHPGGELFVTEQLEQRKYLRQPSILVGIPRWKAYETNQIKRLVTLEEVQCKGVRLKLLEYDPLLALPQELPIVREKAVGAVLFASGAPLTPETIRYLIQLPPELRFCVVGQHLEDFNIPSVSVDDVYAANLAMNHLIHSGHRKIAIFYSEPHSRVMELRCRSAVDYASLHNIEVKVINCGVSAGEIASLLAYRKACEVIRQGFDFTAILGLSGESLLGAVNAFLQAGLMIPDRISVVAIADEYITGRHTPPIDTVGVMIEKQFQAALQMTMSDVCESTRIVYPELMIFGSVKNINSKKRGHNYVESSSIYNY